MLALLVSRAELFAVRGSEKTSVMSPMQSKDWYLLHVPCQLMSVGMTGNGKKSNLVTRLANTFFAHDHFLSK